MEAHGSCDMTSVKTIKKKQFGAGGVCEDLVVCGVKNPASISNASKFTESDKIANQSHDLCSTNTE